MRQRSCALAWGRVCAAITERGRIRCSTVVVAGGAWSRLFLGSLGLTLPQLTIRASVMRTAPLSGGPEGGAKGPGFGFRKRLDGGYTVGHPSRQLHSIVPDSLRFFGRFLPHFIEERKDIQLGLNRRFIDAALTPVERTLPPLERTLPPFTETDATLPDTLSARELPGFTESDATAPGLLLRMRRSLERDLDQRFSMFVERFAIWRQTLRGSTFDERRQRIAQALAGFDVAIKLHYPKWESDPKATPDTLSRVE